MRRLLPFHSERKARLAASISHPRCVFVPGAHEVDGGPVIAMESMTGRALGDELKDSGPIPIQAAVRRTLAADGRQRADLQDARTPYLPRSLAGG